MMPTRNHLPLYCLAILVAPVLAAGELPEGAGKQIIQQHCAGCHPGSALAGYQKTREDWDAIVVRMGQRTAATRDDLTTLADYLATNFPKIDDPTKVNMNKADAKEISERLGLSMTEAEAIVTSPDRGENSPPRGALLVYYGAGSTTKAGRDQNTFPYRRVPGPPRGREDGTGGGAGQNPTPEKPEARTPPCAKITNYASKCSNLGSTLEPKHASSQLG